MLVIARGQGEAIIIGNSPDERFTVSVIEILADRITLLVESPEDHEPNPDRVPQEK